MSVAVGQAIMRQNLREDAELGRAEQCALHAHKPEDDERKSRPSWVYVKRRGPGGHEPDLDGLHGQYDGSFAQPIRKCAGR